MWNESIAECGMRNAECKLTNPKSGIRNFNSRGVSLIAAIFIIVILAFMGVMFVSLINTGSLSSVNDLQSAQALYVAEGGLDYGIKALRNNPLYAGDTNIPLGSGTFTTTVVNSLTTVNPNPIALGDLTINVISTAGFSIPGTIKLDSEYIYCTGTTGTSFTGCTRSFRGTPVTTHSVGSKVYQYSAITSTGTVGSAQRVVRANVDRTGITYFNSASNPADNGTLGASPVAVTPPALMLAGDLVVLIASSRRTGITLNIATTGGQTWTSETVISANGTTRLFWCRYNGTWTANPRVSFSTALNTTVVMHVFRPTIGTNTWALDVTQTTGSYAVPPAPRDVTITGITTVANGALALFVWATTDDVTWGLQTAGWTNAGGAQYRNRASADSSQSAAYRIMATPGATGNVTNRQVTRGGDAGNSIKLAFKQVETNVILDWREIFP